MRKFPPKTKDHKPFTDQEKSWFRQSNCCCMCGASGQELIMYDYRWWCKDDKYCYPEDGSDRGY